MTSDCDVVLLQDGVYLAPSFYSDVTQLTEDFSGQIYALESDVYNSGLSIENLHKIAIISDSKWVELCANNTPAMSVQ